MSLLQYLGKLLRNPVKYGQILFYPTTKMHQEASTVYIVRELSNQNGFTDGAKEILRLMQGLGVTKQLKLESLNQNQIDGLLLHAVENNDRDAILYILKESGKNLITQPSEYCLYRIFVHHVRDRQMLKTCYNLFQNQPWMQPFFVANNWHTSEYELAAEQFRDLYFEAEVKQKRTILHLLRLISEETFGLDKQRSLTTLVQLAEYFVCIFNEYQPLMHVWQTLFKSTWFSDQCLAKELYSKHLALRYRVDEPNNLKKYVKALIIDGNLEACQRLTQLYLEYGDTESTHFLLSSMFDYHYYRGDLKACSEIMRFCLASDIKLTDEHGGKLIDLMLGTTEKESKMKVMITPGVTFKF